MPTLKFLGAAGTVTGSCYLLTGEQNTNLLIDFGMFQEAQTVEELNHQPLQFDVSSLNGVLLTHAHLDHCGRLPLLVKENYQGKIYTTEATEKITNIGLLDAAHLALENKHQPVLYTKDDVDRVMNIFQAVEYDKPFSIGEFTITFRNAGHILGSASIEIQDQKGKIIVFSGDLGNTPEDLIPPTEQISKADTVVMESTYGDTSHPVEDVPAILASEINAIEKNNGVLLIPVFSIERAQEIVHQIGHLQKQGKIQSSTKIFLDSPMAIKVTEVFKEYPNLYNNELSRDSPPFNFDNLTCTPSVEESKAIFKIPGPKIIISGSGMMSGGRILHHLKNYVSIPSTRVLVVGYQAEGTLGREIVNGAKQVLLYKDHVSVQTTITEIKTLSSHADAPKLLQWLKHMLGVSKVFLTHGEDPGRSALAARIKAETDITDIILPMKDQTFETSNN